MTLNRPMIGVLEVGRLPEELANRHGDYPTMIADWLSPLGTTFKTYPVLDGVLPDNPDECDFWIIPGSKFGVYEDHAWIPPLEDFIRACRDANKKIIGICFGHQVIAQALGGVVEKSDKGWGLGVHSYAPIDWPKKLGPAPDKINIQAFHQDQITTIPPGAQRIARSDFCEVAALWYPGFALTVQGHPEFSKSYATDLLRNRRGSVLPEATVDVALENMGADTTRDALAIFIKNHMKQI